VLGWVTSNNLAAAQTERTLLREKRATKMMKAQADDGKIRSGKVGFIHIRTPQRQFQADLVPVVTKYGIISHGKGYLWVPIDRYKVLSDDMPIGEAKMTY
jgi:hypothetical protein